jgi:hypothetical protein
MEKPSKVNALLADSRKLHISNETERNRKHPLVVLGGMLSRPCLFVSCDPNTKGPRKHGTPTPAQAFQRW